MSWNFELVAGPFGSTTEGPVWDGEALLFTNIPANRILRYDPKTGETSEYFTGTNRTNGLCFDAQGNLYGCQSGGRRIVRFEKDGATITSLPHLLDGKNHNNPNDLAVDKQGRIWFTDPFNDSAGDQELDHMSVLRLDPSASDQWELKRVTRYPGIRKPCTWPRATTPRTSPVSCGPTRLKTMAPWASTPRFTPLALTIRACNGASTA